jgi:hypothetical protein
MEPVVAAAYSTDSSAAPEIKNADAVAEQELRRDFSLSMRFPDGFLEGCKQRFGWRSGDDS